MFKINLSISIILFFVITSFSNETINPPTDVQLILREPNIVELTVPSTDFELIINVSRINENEVDEIIYSKTSRCNKPTKSWWIAKPDRYRLEVSRDINGKKTILQRELFSVGLENQKK